MKKLMPVSDASIDCQTAPNGILSKCLQWNFITFAACSRLLNLSLELYKKWKGKEPASMDVLPQSGSERRYFRFHEQDGSTVIGTYGANIKENETFIYFSENFREKITCGKYLPSVMIECFTCRKILEIFLLNQLEEEGLY